MRYFLYFFIWLIIFSNNSYANWGKGPLKLDKFTAETVIMYMYGAGSPKYSGAEKTKHVPLVIAISENGNYSSYFYCPIQYVNRGWCKPEANEIKSSIKSCEKGSNQKCYIFALQRRIVWKNGGPKVKIKKKDLKSPYIVAKKIQEAGFYDGDISKLSGIDIATGQISNETNITGEKKSEESDSDERDIIEELETLTKLYESGNLTKEEFDKAKRKLLNN